MCLRSRLLFTVLHVNKNQLPDQLRSIPRQHRLKAHLHPLLENRKVHEPFFFLIIYCKRTQIIDKKVSIISIR